MADETMLIEKIFSRTALQDNLRIWGKLFIDKKTQLLGGWLIDSWCEGGAPYWQPHLNWVSKKDNKIYRVEMYIGIAGGSTVNHGEDTDIEADRAAFIRSKIAEWQQQWLEEEAKKF
ncbi:MAG TPA: hypothetical protein VMI32_20085 [Candidatus Solibacter sp.]|nr:hypothetical protein [Candidatus Solibacter sp.]